MSDKETLKNQWDLNYPGTNGYPYVPEQNNIGNHRLIDMAGNWLQQQYYRRQEQIQAKQQALQEEGLKYNNIRKLYDKFEQKNSPEDSSTSVPPLDKESVLNQIQDQLMAAKVFDKNNLSKTLFSPVGRTEERINELGLVMNQWQKDLQNQQKELIEIEKLEKKIKPEVLKILENNPFIQYLGKANEYKYKYIEDFQDKEMLKFLSEQTNSLKFDTDKIEFKSDGSVIVDGQYKFLQKGEKIYLKNLKDIGKNSSTLEVEDINFFAPDGNFNIEPIQEFIGINEKQKSDAQEAIRKQKEQEEREKEHQLEHSKEKEKESKEREKKRKQKEESEKDEAKAKQKKEEEEDKKNKEAKEALKKINEQKIENQLQEKRDQQKTEEMLIKKQEDQRIKAQNDLLIETKSQQSQSQSTLITVGLLMVSIAMGVGLGVPGLVPIWAAVLIAVAGVVGIILFGPKGKTKDQIAAENGLKKDETKDIFAKTTALDRSLSYEKDIIKENAIEKESSSVSLYNESKKVISPFSKGNSNEI